jgi:transposase
MFPTTIFSLPADVCLADVCLENEALTLVLRSSQISMTCPECAKPSSRIHGRYTRTLADLPCQGKAVRVRLEVRRFLCATLACPRTTFAERFPTLTRIYGRRTLRQAESLKEVAFAVGGKAGALLAKRLAMSASRDTLLRLIRSTAVPTHKTPQVLGLDDFAWKKGDRYGTLLVDLQAHCPVEVLPDREAATVVRWLRAHRGVKIISRDRAGAYAEAATRGAPRARQVADRYHVLVNLRNTLKDTLARHQAALPLMEGAREAPLTSSQRPTEFAAVSPVPADSPQQPEREFHATEARALTAAERRRQISRANRYARYEQILTLHQQGRSQRDIARQLHLSRRTVHRFVTAESFPERAPTGQRRSLLNPYLPYLRQRWEQGDRNGRQLAREIQAQGFGGSAALVSQLIGKWRASLPVPEPRVRGKKRQAAPPPQRHVSARRASWLFVKPREKLTEEQRALLERICQANTDLQKLYQLGQEFVLMVKQRQPRRLDTWLARAQQSSSVELQGFASGIKRDYAAVKAALSLPWSQGQVEGQITRLKLLKRQMYGRARFELLRSRVLRRA